MALSLRILDAANGTLVAYSFQHHTTMSDFFPVSKAFVFNFYLQNPPEGVV